MHSHINVTHFVLKDTSNQFKNASDQTAEFEAKIKNFLGPDGLAEGADIGRFLDGARSVAVTNDEDGEKITVTFGTKENPYTVSLRKITPDGKRISVGWRGEKDGFLASKIGKMAGLSAAIKATGLEATGSPDHGEFGFMRTMAYEQEGIEVAYPNNEAGRKLQAEVEKALSRHQAIVKKASHGSGDGYPKEPIAAVPEPEA